MGITHFRSDVHVVNGSAIVGDITASYVRLDQHLGIRLSGVDMWDDLRFPADALQVNPLTSKPDTITYLAGYRIYGFSATASEDVNFIAQMPHSWAEGTTIHPHVHWVPTNTATGNVCWELQYSIANVNATYSSTVATMLATQYTDGTANKHRKCSLGTITMTGQNISTIILGRLFRRGEYTIDTYSADAGLLEFDIHFRIDSFGSDQEYTKE